VVVWDERLIRSGTDSSPYPGYSFFEHKEYHISAMQLDDNKVAVALLDGTGSVDFLEPFNPRSSSSSSFSSSSNPYTSTNSSAPTSVLRTFRKLAFDVEKEKKDKKDKERDKKTSLMDRLRIGSRATTPADLEAEDKRAAKQANLQGR
jgi:hypothetical protein